MRTNEFHSEAKIPIAKVPVLELLVLRTATLALILDTTTEAHGSHKPKLKADVGSAKRGFYHGSFVVMWSVHVVDSGHFREGETG